MQHHTIPDLDGDRFPENPQGFDALLKDILSAFNAKWDAEDRARDLQRALEVEEVISSIAVR
ncbi:hypothetical protein [Rhizobium pisi]|uniref:hypothetical protein n=1 Tax=Rhizobium pisi TaxID=574561 RepID=UPI003D013373